MNITKKFLVCLLALVLCVSTLAVQAFATELHQDGLKVSLKTNQDDYANDQTITAMLTVENTNSFAVYDVSLEGYVPKGYTAEKTLMELDTLAAGETVTLEVDLVPNETQTTTTTAPTTSNTDKEPQGPGTGDDAPVWLWIVLLVLAAVVLVWVVCKYHLWKRTLSLVLCGALLVSLFAGVPFNTGAAESEHKSLTISTTVRVDGDPLEIKAAVKYALTASEEQPEDTGSGGSTTTYYKITFANPTDSQYAADTLPASCTVTENTLVYTMTEPVQDGAVFCGWYYDSALTTAAATTDKVTSDLTLYPKMVERQGDSYVTGMGALNYVSSLNVATDFTVQVQAKSEEQICNSLTFRKVSNFDEEVSYEIRSEGNGIYTLIPKGGLEAGSTYQIAATDREDTPVMDEEGVILEQDGVRFLYEGEVQPIEVCYYNITVYLDEHSNIKVNSDVIFLPYDQVEGFSFDGSALFKTDLENIKPNDQEGSFVYYGSGIAVGDVVAIYDGVLSEDRTVDGDVSYVQITDISDNHYRYVIPGIEDVIFLPEALPMPMDDETTEDIDGAYFNDDGTLTVYNEYLNFARYADVAELAEMELDGETTADVGDYLVLYSGELSAPTQYAYYEITQITKGDVGEVTIFTLTEKDSFEGISAYEVYRGDLDISEEAIAQLEDETAQQALESGFAEEAAKYLARTLINSGKMPEEFNGMELSNIEVRSASENARGGGDHWYDGGNWELEDGDLLIEAGKLEAGVGTLMVEVGKVDVHVNGSTSLKEITGMQDGVRLELGICFPVQIGNYLVGTGWTECVNLSVSASFVQEIAFSPYASLDVEVGWFWIFPYIRDILVDAGADVGTYIGVGGTFTVISGPDFGEVFPWVEHIQKGDPNYSPLFPNVDSIARTLENMMNNTTTFLDGYEGTSLITMYQELLEKEIDYVQILELKFPPKPLSFRFLGGILEIRIEIALCVSAKMSVTVGMATEVLSVKRYFFTLRLFSGQSSSGQIDLQTPYTNFNLYLMGNLGLRVGPKITVMLSALSGLAKSHNLANVGFSAEIGYTMDIYGIFFYHFRMEDGRVKESKGVGALDLRHGMYFDVDFFFGAFLNLLSATVHGIDLTYYFTKLEDNSRVMEASNPVQNHTLYNDETFSIRGHHLRMNMLQVKSGAFTTKNDLTTEDFDISLSNPKFIFDKKTGGITYQDTDDGVKDTCEIRLTYLGNDTLFQVTPIVINMTLNWVKTKPKYSVRIFTETFLGSTSRNDYGWGTWPDHDSKIWEKVYIAGDTITEIPFTEPTKQGYNFKGWYYSLSGLKDVEHLTPLSELNHLEGYIMPEGNIDIVAMYEPRTDTPYTVEYYVQRTDGSDLYDLYASVDHIGTTADDVGFEILRDYRQDVGDMDGFSLDYGRFPKHSFEYNGETHFWFVCPVLPDGSTVAKVYFNREKCDIFFHVNNPDYTGSNHTTISDYYGAPLDLPDDLVDLEITGWELEGWVDHEGNFVDLPKTMPSQATYRNFLYDGVYYQGGTHYFAKWTPKYNLITILHYLEQLDGTYELYEVQVGYPDVEDEDYRFGGLTGSYIFKEEFLMDIDGASYSHYTAENADGTPNKYIVGVDSDEPGVASHNGQILKIYYDRNYERIAWNTDGSNYINENSVITYYYEGQEIFVPDGVVAAQKPGYDLVGWKNVVGKNSGEVHTDEQPLTMGADAKLFVPNYVPQNGTPYTVEHYLQREDGTYSDRPSESYVYGGTTDSWVKPEVNSYTGFESPVAREVQIAGDGSTVVKYRYSRMVYGVRVEFQIEGENLILRGNYPSSYLYGAPFELSDKNSPLTIYRKGYRIAGWYLADEELNPDQTLLDNTYYMVYGDALYSQKELVFKPMWEKVPYDYRVEHYLEQLDGSYLLQQTDMGTGYMDDVVTAQAVSFTGFTLDEANSNNVVSGTIEMDGSLALKLYYARNRYDVNWYAYDGATVLAVTQVKYKDTIVPPESYDADTTRTGYTMTGWKTFDYGTVTTTGASFTAADYGLWTANPYTVSFQANGGQGTMESQSFVWDEAQNLNANEFTRPGYTFAGWSYTPAGSVIFADMEQVENLATSGTVKLFAIWNARTDTPYKVEHYGQTLEGEWELLSHESLTGVTDTTARVEASEFEGFAYDVDAENVTQGNINGEGSLVLKLYYSRNSYTLKWLDYDGQELVSQTVLFEAPLVAPEDALPSRTGYTFFGWNVSGTMPAENTAFSAKEYGDWTANTYTVSYHANGAKGTMESQSFTYDQPQQLMPNGFTKAGYIFLGWSKEADGEVIYTDQQQIENLAESGNVELFAVWTPGDGYAYQVEHYLQQLDGSYQLDNAASFTGVMDSEVSASAMKIQGFIFNADHPNTVSTGKINAEGTLVLKLYYDRQSYTATLVDTNGSSLAAWQVPFGAAVTVPENAATPVREGYIFGGWADLGTMPAEDKTYSVADFGSWKANTYTVTFDANGGEGSMASQTFTYDVAQKLTSNGFTKNGYHFNGWSLSQNGEVKYTDQEQVSNLAASGNVTLYAQWLASTADYQVVHYGEKLDGTGFEVIKTESCTGVIGSEGSAVAATIEGFTYDAANGSNVTSGIINADADLVLELYYTRNSYTLTLDFNAENMKGAVMDEDTEREELVSLDVPDITYTVKHGQPLDEFLTGVTALTMVEDGSFTWDNEVGDFVYVDPVYEEVPFETAFPGYVFEAWENLCDTMPMADLTLTAQWKPIEITVTFNPGSYHWFVGEEVVLEPVTETFTYGSEIELPFDYFAIENCTATGWFFGDSQWNYPTIVEKTLPLVYGYYNEFYEGTEITIAPYWVSNGSLETVTFHGNGAEGTMDLFYFNGGDGYGYLPRNKFTKEGYVFAGWNTAADGSGERVGPIEVYLTESTILYAQWIPVEE